jgi:hypothetical protein
MTGRCHNAQFFFVFFIKIGSHRLFCLDWTETQILLISISHVSGMKGEHYCTQLLVEMGSHELFAWGGLKLLISASQIARITTTGAQLFSSILWKLIAKRLP